MVLTGRKRLLYLPFVAAASVCRSSPPPALTLWLFVGAPFVASLVFFLVLHPTSELAFMKIVPGKEFKASVTPKGNVPIYKVRGSGGGLLW
jgi:hypothetical protein